MRLGKDFFVDNIVITSTLGVTLNLKAIASQWKRKGVQMNLKRFPNLVFAWMRPKVTILLFRSGTIVAEGCKVESEGVFVIWKTCMELRKIGYEEAHCSEFTIQNVVGNMFFPFGVNLHALSKSFAEYCLFNPKSFPGVTIRNLAELEDNTCIVFWTGSMLVIGGRSRRQVKRVAQRMLAKIKVFSFKEGEDKASIIRKINSSNNQVNALNLTLEEGDFE